MRSAACLVQVEMYNIESHVTGTCDTKYCVGIRAIVVQLPTNLMHHFRDLRDIGIEEAECVWIGHHNRCDARAVRVQQCLQMLHVDTARCRVTLDLNGFIIGKRRASRISAMCVIGNEDEVAMSLTLALMMGFNQHQAR